MIAQRLSFTPEPNRAQHGLGILRLGLIALLLTHASLTQAQDEVAADAEASVSRMETQRQALESNASLSDTVRSAALELMNRAIDEQRSAARLNTEISQLRERIESAPETLRQLQSRLDQAESAPLDTNHAQLGEEALNARVREAETELATARDTLKTQEKALAEIATQGLNLANDLGQHKESLRKLQDGPTQNIEQAATTAEARQAYNQARRNHLTAQIRKAELQLENHELLLQLATLERDISAARVARLDQQRESLFGAIQKRRVQDARQATEDARQAEAISEGLPAAVSQVAREHAALREEYERLMQQSADTAEKLRSTERRAGELDAELASLRQRLQGAGRSETIGRLLRRQLKSAQQAQTLLSAPATLASKIARATDRRIELAEQRSQLIDIQAATDALLTREQETAPTSDDSAELRNQTRQLVSAKRSAIDALNQAYGRYLGQLTDLRAAQQQLTEIVDSMLSLIRREHLWIRSLPPIALSDFASMPAATTRLLSPERWRRAATDALQGFSAHPVLAALGLTGILILVALRRLAQQRLARLAKKAASIRSDRFSHTLVALVLTIMLVATWPLLVAHLGWLISAAPDAALFSRHLGETLLVVVAQFLIILTGTRWVVHPDGLARRHFGWPEPACRSLHTELRWLMGAGIACVVVVVLAERDGADDIRLAIGRPATMLFSIALMIFIWRLLRPSAALITWLRQHKPDSLVTRSWKIWFPTLLAIPGVNLIATAAGYQYTAGVATGLLIKTGWLLLIVSVLRGIMLRWFTVSERRMRFEQALAKRDEVRAERARRQEEGQEAQTSEVVEVEVPRVDFREIGAQGRAIVHAVVVVGAALSLWALWSDLLPALDVLERMRLPMHRAVIVDGIEQRVAVTVADAGITILVLVASLFAAKNLSGLLGFTLLRRVAGDAGAQYAIITLFQYLIVGAGLIYALSGIGLQWSKLQWLVAALGVGLGFGLQEIVANFVSGIILLLERPIRVGDTVTVGDATGTVSRIRIRATTILDWDRKELVVPNKEFVTGRLLNWTLSNNVLRVVIPVGIAYGSDARLARKLLMEAAKEHENVLEDPAPIVAFTSFGDNALVLELRVYIPSIEYLLSSQTELRDAIYDKLNQAGITIAFPQRDVHLDTSSPLDIRLHRGGRSEE